MPQRGMGRRSSSPPIDYQRSGYPDPSLHMSRFKGLPSLLGSGAGEGYFVLVALDQDLVMHAGHGHRPWALCAPLPEESQGELETVCARTLYRSVDPFGEPLHADATPAGEGAGFGFSTLHPQSFPLVPGGQAGVGLEEPPLVEGSFLEGDVCLVLGACKLLEALGALAVQQPEVDCFGQLAVFFADTSVSKTLRREGVEVYALLVGF